MPLPKNLKSKHPSNDTKRDIVDIYRSIASLFSLLKKNIPFLDGNSITVDINGGGSSTLVAHKLGRQWKGWFVTSSTSSSLLTEDSQDGIDGTKYILFKKSGVTKSMTIWIF